MYTDEELEKLEEEEHAHAVEQFVLISLLLSSILADLEKELSLFYKKYGTDGVVTYQQSRKRIGDGDNRKRQTLLFLEIDEIFEKLLQNSVPTFEKNLKYIIGTEIDFFGIEVDLEDILSTGWGADDLTWLDRLWSHKQKWVDVISTDIKRGFLRRDNISTILDSLGDRFKSIEKVLWKLYVTESTAVNSITRKKMFKEMGVTQYRFYTRADERTCSECGSLHGRIFPMSAFEVGVTASPIHPHCRCWEIPIIRD